MALEVTVTNDDFPKGFEFTINGLGVFKNGETREVTADQERAFVAETGMGVRDSVKASEVVSAKGTSSVKDSPPVGVSDTASLDPTVENKKAAEKAGTPVELISVGGISSPPDTIDDEVAVPDTPVVLTKPPGEVT